MKKTSPSARFKRSIEGRNKQEYVHGANETFASSLRFDAVPLLLEEVGTVSVLPFLLLCSIFWKNQITAIKMVDIVKCQPLIVRF